MKNSHLLEMNTLLSKSDYFDFLQGLDSDEALDSRDEDPFDSAWMDDFNAVEAEKAKLSKDDLSFIDSLRELAFKGALRASDDSEVSARVSDDIELIAKSFLLHKEDSWSIQVLWQSYKNRKFPT
ncbi:hypothetical protein C4J88_5355 [Pseudomonas sp. R4-39-08]|uniref:hypothetical protein n=1 Tax=Pseudomonas sp. R4-39-08 TaxID=1173288 RepID=UPI000F56A417|nr:hypothetical protein [Pseudomonas sp. R4-39-08]AZF40088.1 hypothetical protein C4J88_5355 [Pseudomonas sp. R4-39-08]